jgi:signal transduction histidine kinase
MLAPRREWEPSLLSDEEILTALKALLSRLRGGEPEDLDDELRNWWQRLRRMETLGRLAAAAAPDFSRLLTVILGYSDLVKFDLPEGNPQRDVLEEMGKSAFQAAHLSRQFLSLSKPSDAGLDLLDLNGVVADTCRMLQGLLGGAVELVHQQSPGVGFVQADRGLVEQILIELVCCSLDALPNGGRITVSTANLLLREDLPYPQGFVPAGNYVRLTASVRRPAPIEPVDELPDGEETASAMPGHLLDLALLHSLVRQCQGHMLTSHERGKGGTCAVYLRRYEETKQWSHHGPRGV